MKFNSAFCGFVTGFFTCSDFLRLELDNWFWLDSPSHYWVSISVGYDHFIVLLWTHTGGGGRLLDWLDLSFTDSSLAFLFILMAAVLYLDEDENLVCLMFKLQKRASRFWAR